MMKALKGILSERLQQQGISDVVEAAQVTEAFKQEVAKRFGPASVDSFRKLALKGDTLEVSVGSSALASELRMLEFDLKDALQARFPNKTYRLKIFA